MGAFLAKKLVWSGGKLEDSEENIVTLRFVLRRVRLLCKAMPEIATAPFEPLRFESVVIPGDFRGVSCEDIFNLEPWKIESKATYPGTDRHIYSLESATGQTFTATIGSLQALDVHLLAAGERQTKEMKRLLEAYPNVTGSMVGMPDAAPDQLLPMQLDVVEKLSGGDDATALAHARQRLTFLLALYQMELLLVAAALDRASRVGPRITMGDVKRQRRLLRLYCGAKPGAPLVSVEWESSVRFSSGVGAPPWRQARGELCYLVVETRDAGQLCVTCAHEGYFVNRGHYVETRPGGAAAERINYERAGPVYPTLVELLRAHSPHFNATVDQWDVPLRSADHDGETATSMQDDDDDSDSELAALMPQRGPGAPPAGTGAAAVATAAVRRTSLSRASSSPKLTTTKRLSPGLSPVAGDR